VSTADAAQWSEVVGDSLVRVASRSLSEEPFSGRITHAVLDGIGLSTVESGAQEVVRTASLIARDSRSLLLVNVQTAGHSLARQDGRHAELSPGDLTVLDSTRPYALEFAEPFSQIVVQVPRQMLPSHVWKASTALVLGDEGPGRVVTDFILGLNRQQRDHPAVAAALLPHLVGLLESLLDWAAEESSGHPASALIRQRIHRFVRQHAHDPSLDAARIAAACGVSRRTMYRALADDGEPLATLIRRLRVARAEHLLRDRPGLPIAVVAAESGFGGPSQLHRVFRATVGMTPALYRAGRPADLCGGGRPAQ
jgi:AraC-like DNA-binding protein